MENQGPQTIRLRRMTPRTPLNKDLIPEDVIQKNLEPLKQNIQKKIRAQEMYYQNSPNIGASPMTREYNRQPIQQRLGKKVPFMGTNSSMIPPKKRLFKNTSTLNSSISKKKLSKRNYAQMRLNKIRERHRYQSLLVENNQNAATKRVKLHRMVPNNTVPNIPNFKIQVRNNGHLTNNILNGIKRHRIALDTDIQIAINQLKTMYTGEKYIILKVTPKSTTISMNDRFSCLS